MDAPLSSKLVDKIATLCITMQKVLFISTVRLPDEQTGRTDPDNESMLAAMHEARSQWIAVEKDDWRPMGQLHFNPRVPDSNGPNMTRSAEDRLPRRLVESRDHPLAKRLLGMK